MSIVIENKEGLEFLDEISSSSINLVLTDPPYIISKQTGMNLQAQIASEYKDSGKTIKTEEEWDNYKTTEEWDTWMTSNDIVSNKQESKLKTLKQNYINYGSIYGKKYAVVTDYGAWDSDFTIDILDKFIHQYYRVLTNGGTLILFFDIWKITILKELMEKAGFKQIRFIEWIKTNPQPLNSSINYLTNCREIALLGIKKSKPTFNSKYDNAIYSFPLQGGKNRFHPTQKSLLLFEELIKKHSNEGDIVLDTFLGSGTTALAAKKTNRSFKGCEISEEYYNKMMKLINPDE